MARPLEYQKWTPHLDEITAFRKQRDFHGAQFAKWILLGGILFIVLWFFFGEIAVFAFGASLFIFFYLSFQTKYLSGVMKNTNDSQSMASLAEKNLLQQIANENASWLKLSSSGPDLLQPVMASEMFKGRIDLVSGYECLAGQYKNTIPFCAMFIDAQRIDKHLNSKKRIETKFTTIFQGIFLVMDFPIVQNGWVTIESDNLAKLGWLADDWRQISETEYIQVENPDFEKFFHVKASNRLDGFKILSPKLISNLVEFYQKRPNVPLSMTFREGMVMMALPMKKNPFTLSENKAVWKNELEDYNDFICLLVDFITTLKPDHF